LGRFGMTRTEGVVKLRGHDALILRRGEDRITGRGEIDQWYADAHGLTVRAGPFAGMRYPRGSAGRVHLLTPKLLGTYEQELALIVATEAARRPPLVVHVGSEDGYYAVGLARALPRTRVHAFEADPAARRAACRLARANDVAWRVDVRGPASVRRLSRLDLDDAFVLVEGSSGVDLLGDELLPALRTATVLVELGPDADLVRDRFEPSHDEEIVVQRGRDLDAHAPLAELPVERRALALDEDRTTRARWALFTPVAG
jgi:hypothetical protein